MATTTEHPPFSAALGFWAKLGFINVGGPTAQIALMHTELVDRRRWISDGRFLHALNYCMLLPGPEAQQLAIYVGWLLHGTGGGLVAGILFVLPGFFIMLGLAWLFAAHGSVLWVAGLFAGFAAAVVGIVATAAIRIGSKTLHNRWLVGIAVASLAAILAKVPFPVIILFAGLTGLLASRRWPEAFRRPEAGHGSASGDGETAVLHDEAETPDHAKPSARRTVIVVLVGLAAWVLPLLVVSQMHLGTPVFADGALFFSKAAMVTFGGAYAVLAYLNQQAVMRYGWLASSQMAAGLGLAETTPGPLINVVIFVGFLAGFQQPGSLPPVAAGLLGGTVAAWATFAPCFLWIFLGAPWIERLRNNRVLEGALTAITAAVVGVITSLFISFAATTLFGEIARTVGALPIPDVTTVDVVALAIAVATFLAIRVWKLPVIPVILVAGTIGIGQALLF